VLDTTVNPAKTDEPIEMLFGRQTRVGPRHDALDRYAHWRHLVNTTERGGDASLWHITLTICRLSATSAEQLTSPKQLLNAIALVDVTSSLGT